MFTFIHLADAFKMHNAKCKVLIRLEATAKALMMDK